VRRDHELRRDAPSSIIAAFDAHASKHECRNLTTRGLRIAIGDGMPQHLRLCPLGVAC
jgi:hypothetical protein